MRITQPLRELAKHGHEVTFSVSRETETIEHMRNAASFDVVVCQRLAGYKGMPMWRRARTPANRLVYETDDDLFNVDPINWSAYEQFRKPDIREAIMGYCQTADLITVTCENLAEVHRELNKSTAVLPNCIPEYVLELPRTENRRPRLGWVGGASHGLDIHEASSSVRRFLARNDKWDLYLGGMDYRPSFNVRNWDQMLFAEWRDIFLAEREYYESIDFEIGLAPLKDTEFARSKSPIKALEYNARGIPVIASDVLPYRDYIVHGENGFLVKDNHEWMKYIRLLADNPDLRKEMGEKGKIHAGELTVENNWQRWEKAYEGLF